MVRIVAENDLQDWEVTGPGGHFKVFMLQDDGEQVARTYTVRQFDREKSQLTIDFAIHADGPATRFASSAKPGDQFEVSAGSRPGFQPRPESAWTILIADQSALPALCAIVETLPACHEVHALIEVPSLTETVSVTSAAIVEPQWIVESEEPCARLVDAALGLELPDGHGEIWVGCEAGAMRSIRRHLLLERGLSSRDVYTRAYWKRGAVAHTDHDMGEEIVGANND
jgi:NADPH-dependent ferric siderophore reductase